MSFRERLDAWLTERRLRLYPRVVLAALIVGYALAVAGGEGARALSGRLGGDFPAFYSAARIAAARDFGSLYDFRRQASAQAALFPAEDGAQMLPFTYPPYVALLYRPLASLPYRAAYVLHTLLMAGALLLCVWWLRDLAPKIARYPVEAYAAAVSFAPMFVALVGGQPAPLLLCALVGAFHASQRGHPLRAGLWLGLLFWKPQYAIPWIALFALARQFRVVLGALVVGGLCYVAATAILGPTWLVQYADALVQFQLVDQRHNAAHSIGVLGVAEALLGPGKPAALAIGALLGGACVAYAARLWSKRAALALPARLAVTSPLVLLLQPHAMQYDAAFLVPSLAVLADLGGRRAILPLGLVYFAALAMPFADRISVSPAFGVVLATFVLVHRELVTLPAEIAPTPRSAR